MRAVRCVDGQVVVREMPPAPDGGVRVRVRSAGICGSDLHMVAGGRSLPHVMGHELAGELADGRPVAVEPLVPCGHCDSCATGAYNRCRLGFSMVYGVGRDGGMADEISVPERCLVPLPGGLPASDACLVEPLAVAVHGLRRAELRGGSRVAVVGGGSIGLLCVAAAAASGAEVSLVARHDAQRAAGERLGARIPAEGEFDLVVDAAGTAGALALAVERCRPGGTLLLLATYWEGLELPGFAVSAGEIRILPANMYARRGPGRDVDLAAALLAGTPEIARALITHRFPLDAAPEAFATAADRKSGAIKVVLEP